MANAAHAQCVATQHKLAKWAHVLTDTQRTQAELRNSVEGFRQEISTLRGLVESHQPACSPPPAPIDHGQIMAEVHEACEGFLNERIRASMDRWVRTKTFSLRGEDREWQESVEAHLQWLSDPRRGGEVACEQGVDGDQPPFAEN